MTRRPVDTRTMDLLSWEPDELVPRFDERRVRAATLRSRIAFGVAATLKDADLTREEVATHMADWLEEDVAKSTLDAYASEERQDCTITVVRTIAMMRAARDYRLAQLILEPLGLVALPQSHENVVHVARLRAKRDEVDREIKALNRLTPREFR